VAIGHLYSAQVLGQAQETTVDDVRREIESGLALVSAALAAFADAAASLDLR
jgi:hypothetical protein